MKQLYALIAMLMMASVAFTGCVSDDGDTTDTVVDDTNDGTGDGTDDGTGDGTDDGTGDGTDDGTDDGTVTPVGTESTSTLDDVIAAGEMKCGVKTSQFGMGYLAEDGTRSGLDIEYCRAIAAAIGLDPDDDIEYVLATGSNRFELLSSGDIDVLIRTTTWTTSRELHESLLGRMIK